MEEPCAAYGDVAPADEGVGGVVVDEDGQVDGRAPEGELEVAVPHLSVGRGWSRGRGRCYVWLDSSPNP